MTNDLKDKIQIFPLSLLTLLTTFCFGQVQTYYIKPLQTDPNYLLIEDSSAVSRNISLQHNKLFLFIGGTSSSSSTDYNALRLHSANLGFDFINLSYPNNVAAASLASNSDSLVFNKYRQEVCFGTPVSDDVTVDTLNSIYTRTLKLIQYLDLTYPLENWGQYLSTPTSIDWSKIIVGGHSQGSGHACYLAKHFSVDRVLLFSGPNDYSDTFTNSANWLRQSGVTPTNKHFAYLSLNDDVVPFFKQFVNISGLEMLTTDDTTLVDNISSPFGDSHCLYTTQPPGIVIFNHNVPIKLSTINNGVWTYMLTTEIVTGLSENEKNLEFTLFPNPTSSFIHIQSPQMLTDKTYFIQNTAGQLILSGKISEMHHFNLDLAMLTNGLYFITVDNHTTTIIKQ